MNTQRARAGLNGFASATETAACIDGECQCNPLAYGSSSCSCSVSQAACVDPVTQLPCSNGLASECTAFTSPYGLNYYQCACSPDRYGPQCQYSYCSSPSDPLRQDLCTARSGYTGNSACQCSAPGVDCECFCDVSTDSNYYVQNPYMYYGPDCSVNVYEQHAHLLMTSEIRAAARNNHGACSPNSGGESTAAYAIWDTLVQSVNFRFAIQIAESMACAMAKPKAVRATASGDFRNHRVDCLAQQTCVPRLCLLAKGLTSPRVPAQTTSINQTHAPVLGAHLSTIRKHLVDP